MGGFALLFGILTRVAALGEIIIQLGAVWTVTAARGFSFAHGGGAEFNVALIAMCLALVLAGPGTLAVDNVVFTRRAPAPPATAPPAAAQPTGV